MTLCGFDKVVAQSSPLRLYPQDSLRASLPVQLLKWDMLSLVQRVGQLSFRGEMTVAYERKINLAWSGIGELGVPYRINLGDQAISLPGASYRARASLGIRWYYRLRNRMAWFPKLNPFSANYFSVLTQTRILPRFQTGGNPQVAYLITDGLGFGLVYGVQRRFSSKSYFDMAGGILTQYQGAGNPNPGWDLTPLVSIRLGLAR